MYVPLNEQWPNLALWVCCECTGSTTTHPANSLHTVALLPNLHMGIRMQKPSTVSLPYAVQTHTTSGIIHCLKTVVIASLIYRL